MSENAELPNDAEAKTEPPPRKSAVPIAGLIALALVAATCGWAAYIYITGKDGFDWNRFAFQSKPKLELVPVTGQLFYNGEPMVNGIIRVYPVDPESGTKVAVGPLAKDGTFKMLTDTETGMAEGVYPGEYHFALEVLEPSRGASAPRQLLPEKYYGASTTPVKHKIVVGEKNHFVIKETGPPIKSAGPPGGGSGKKRSGGKRPNRDEIIKRIFENDKNSDGKIIRDEAPDRLKARFDDLDANKDGGIDRKELEAGFRRGRKRPKRKKTN